jgi:hypothetical protein
VLNDAGRYIAWYGVDGVFLDRLGSARRDVDRLSEISGSLRASALVIAANPGQPDLDPEVIKLVDHLVVFEGSAADYAVASFPPESRDGRAWHLVYGAASDDDLEVVLQLARERRAGTVFVTDGELPNPWNHLPPYWATLLADGAGNVVDGAACPCGPFAPG